MIEPNTDPNPTLTDFVFTIQEHLTKICSTGVSFYESPARFVNDAHSVIAITGFYREYRRASASRRADIISAVLMLCLEERATLHLSQSNAGFRLIANGVRVIDEESLQIEAHRGAGYILAAAIQYRLALGVVIRRKPECERHTFHSWTGEIYGRPAGSRFPEVGVAGGAAVMLRDDPNTTASDVAKIFDYCCSSTEVITLMTATEQSLVGDADVSPACETVFDIFAAHRTEFKWLAKRLFDRKELRPEEVAEYFASRPALGHVVPSAWPSSDYTEW